jgi:integrase
MKARGMGRMYVRGRTVWVQLHAGGRKIRLSTGVQVGLKGEIPKAAKDFYIAKLAELGRGTLKEGKEPRFEDLRDAVITRYEAEDRPASLKNARTAFGHLAAKFAGWKASEISDQAVLAYAVARRDRDGVAIATVNLELRLLRRSFRLLKKRIPDPPDVHELPGTNKRRGTVPDAFLEEILSRLAPHYRAMAWFLRLTGWRSCEPPRLEWRHVDFEARSVRLEKSKNGRPRERAFDVHLEALLKGIKANQEAAGTLTPYVFCMPDGDRIRPVNFQCAWTRACKVAGYKGGAHNLRRTRIREQEMQGTPMTVGMAMAGVETPSIYRDYASIGVSEQAKWLEQAPPVVKDNVRKFGRTG